MSALRASPSMTAWRTASALSTGRVPGMARSAAQAWRLGSAPKAVAAPENSLERVVSWTCTSSPITVSHCMTALLVDVGGAAPVPVGHLLIAVADVEQPGFGKVGTDELQAHRKRVHQAAGQGQRRQPRQVGTNGEHILQSQSLRCLAGGLQGKGRAGAGGPDDEVHLVEGLDKVVAN